jgi:acyl-CoA hydrolase
VGEHLKHQVTKLSLDDAPDYIARASRHGRVYIPSGPVEPLALADAFASQSEKAADVTFTSLMIPGINFTDWAALHPRSRGEVFLPSQSVRGTIESGQTRLLPLHYSAAFKYLCQSPFQVAIFHVCPPDAKGRCNSSLSYDASAAFLDRDILKIGIINNCLPHILGAPDIAFDMFDVVIEADHAPIQIPPVNRGGQIDAIGAHVGALVENGATLQAGIGRLPSAIVSALSDHKGLKVHSGLIGDWALDLLASGALGDEPGSLVAGVILGSVPLHEALKAYPRLSLRPISVTHSYKVLAGLPRFTSINAALEIDLFGQINCEYAGQRRIGGIGGALDFLRGARASHGGKPIVTIASVGKDGTSRIVPRLNAPTVSITRADAPIVVTEYGSTDLEMLDTQARAQAIIGLAAPQHREALSKVWRDSLT